MFMRNWIIIIIIIAAISALAYNYGLFGRGNSTVCFDSKCFMVAIATTPYEKARGLAFVENLDRDGGMLFFFDDDGVYPFWMEDTLIPLDIIWIDSNRRVVYISRNAQPCLQDCDSIDPKVPARYVLEINAGESTDIRIGDRVTIV
jgi:uncharacterized protein